MEAVSDPIASAAQGQQPLRKVDMGDYEPVYPWPQPLPDTDLQHAGWTWGSGAGVWAETPDRVWVAQRGEIGHRNSMPELATLSTVLFN